MKIFYTILKILAALIITVTIILFSASFLMQDKIAGLIIRSLSKNISTKFEFNSVKLSFLKKFPKASLDFKSVLVHSSSDFDKKQFPVAEIDTLLSARSVSVDFDITDIINGIYNIDRIRIIGGKLNLLTDTTGSVNYEINVKNTTSAGTGFKLKLERILVSDLRVSYNNLATKLFISGLAKNAHLKSSISGKDIDFAAAGILKISYFKLFNFFISKNISSDIDVNLHRSANGIIFRKSSVILDGYNFGLVGTISSDNKLDLSLTADNIDVAGIKNYFPEKYSDKFSPYNPAGIMSVVSRIRGPVSRTSNPEIDISFILNNGSVTYGSSALRINNLSFKGLFSNGSLKIPATSILSVSDFKCAIGSSAFSGSLVLRNFDSLSMDLMLTGKMKPSDIKEFFDLKNISSINGNIDFNLKMNGIIPKKDKYLFRDFFTLNPAADLHFNSFGIGLKNDKIKLISVNGTLILDDTVTARDLRFIYKDHEFDLNGHFLNLVDWLYGKPVMLIASADLSCNKLEPGLLFSAPGRQDVTVNKKAYTFPGDILLNLNFKADRFSYKSFQADKIAALISYKSGLVNVKSLKLNSLDGVISCNGFIVQNADRSFIGKGTFALQNIDINKAFVSFHNFGQNFIKAENLAGSLSGSLSLLLPMDSLMKPVIKSVSAEGKYTLMNGALINFEPVKALSSFIEISELENINFEKLENDFFIKNNYFYAPQMDVKSSAADLSVNGKHGFDNNYEYHVKILLSEMLSKKIHKPRPNTTEFGAVQDDGLGRTSMLLRIENKGEDIKVGYDLKAAGNKIRNEIKSEKQNLKSILREEYGWFKKDTAAVQTKRINEPRFKITWEETDTVKVEEVPPAEKKENVIKNLFKKK